MESAHVDDVPTRYRAFADNEVRDRTPEFAVWSRGIAEDQQIAELIASLPPLQRQPVLVYAAARFVGVPDTTDYQEFRTAFQENFEQIREVAATHKTQTNEARRIGCLLPFIASAAAANPSGKVSLIEAGASAGLCLYPDRYSFSFPTLDAAEPYRIENGASAPVMEVELRGMIAPPRHVPEIAYRGGVDLNPLDPGDAETRKWLTALVWPGHTERVARLHACLDIAAEEPANILAGDLIERIPEAVEQAKQAAPDATPIVFHTAVLAYLEPNRREQFAALMAELAASHGVVWLSNEGIPIFPHIAEKLPAALRKHRGMFTIAVNGTPLATTHGHGEWVRSVE